MTTKMKNGICLASLAALTFSFGSITSTFGAAPNPPSGLTAHVISCNSIQLKWKSGSIHTDGFRIERATAAAGPFTQIATVGANVTTYTALGLDSNTTYYFRVRAYTGSDNSAYTQVKNAKTTVCSAWDRSSLRAQSGCSVNGSTISATVCNSGSGNMTGPANWELYYAPSGNAKNGSVVCSGTLGPLNSGQCTTVSCSQTAAGNYIFKYYQRPGHPGTGVAWSQQCTKGASTTTTTTSTVVTGGGTTTTTSTVSDGHGGGHGGTTTTSSSSSTTKPTTTTTSSVPSDGWDKSSLGFSAGCSVNGNLISATLCNNGSGNMAGPTTWQLYYAPSGNPKNGSVVCSGTVPALNSSQCTTLSCTQTASGNYMFKAIQRPGHPGAGVTWSNGCTK